MMARLIDADKRIAEIKKQYCTDCENYGGVKCRACWVDDAMCLIDDATTVDAVEMVRCKECRWAKPYERMDGKTGYYCQFCGHSFKYGNDWERLYNPIKESDDFCSYGERKEGGGNG